MDNQLKKVRPKKVAERNVQQKQPRRRLTYDIVDLTDTDSEIEFIGEKRLITVEPRTQRASTKSDDEILIVGEITNNLSGEYVPLHLIDSNPKFYDNLGDHHVQIVPPKPASLHSGSDLQVHHVQDLTFGVSNSGRLLCQENLDFVSVTECHDAIRLILARLRRSGDLKPVCANIIKTCLTCPVKACEEHQTYQEYKKCTHCNEPHGQKSRSRD